MGHGCVALAKRSVAASCRARLLQACKQPQHGDAMQEQAHHQLAPTQHGMQLWHQHEPPAAAPTQLHPACPCAMLPPAPHDAAAAGLTAGPCRALLEAWAAQMWAQRTGVLLWKSQNPWTGLRGQLYDCLLGPTGGFYGAAVALRPLHALLDPLTLQVCLALLLLLLLLRLGLYAGLMALLGVGLCVGLKRSLLNVPAAASSTRRQLFLMCAVCMTHCRGYNPMQMFVWCRCML